MDLKDKRALVTGGNSGIGKAIAEAFAAAGARVAINYVAHPEAAKTMCTAINRGRREESAIAIEADVSDPSAVEAMFAEVDTHWNGVDILVNNAGIDGARNVGWEAEPDAWRKTVEINLFGAFYCAREAMRRMVAQKQGVVINMSSVHEVIPWGGYSAYAASKAGVSMLTKTLAQEAGEHGVRVVAIAPGAVKTPINRSVWSDQKGLADLLDKIPAGDLGLPEDIARMALMLASDASRYVTGTTVFVDGGMTLYPSFRHGG
ncbi:MAG: glucose 1-dehydrogenase [Gammaproteobacteria bacterium]|nr:glucose 1-dehydrogenase [Gammaproteobacteria bacterium]